MAKKTTKAPVPVNKTSRKARRLIRILHDDHNFDIIEKLVDLYARVCKSRMKPQIKYKQEFQILNALLQYAYPKLQAIESDTKIGDNIQFNIQIPSPTPKNPKRVKGVAVNTVKDKDGTFKIKGK